MRVPAGVVVIFGLALGLAGCGAGGSDGAATQASGVASASANSGPAPGAGCLSRVGNGRPVRFGNNGATNLGGIVFGSGHAGVVLAHQAEADLCQWVPYALELAGRGYQVLAFDFPGFGYSSTAIPGEHLDAAAVAAATFLRGQGASSLVLIGASMGGTAVLAAAAELQPPVAGVVSVSGPTQYLGVAAVPAAAKLTVPVLYAAGRADDEFARAAQTLYDATPATTDRKLLIVGAGLHGVDLVADGSEVEAAIAAFLAAHAPA